jgi:hypothetical protein
LPAIHPANQPVANPVKIATSTFGVVSAHPWPVTVWPTAAIRSHIYLDAYFQRYLRNHFQR